MKYHFLMFQDHHLLQKGLMMQSQRLRSKQKLSMKSWEVSFEAIGTTWKIEVISEHTKEEQSALLSLAQGLGLERVEVLALLVLDQADPQVPGSGPVTYHP